jgi:hypothetical protein
MFSGQWPEPQVGPNRIEEGKLIPVTEAERREKFFEAIEDSHPLMDLIHRCINNDPQLRPHAGEIVRRVSRVATQFPASFINRLEILRQIERERREKSALTEEGERKENVIQEKNDEILIHREEILALSEKGEKKDGIILQQENQISSLRKEAQVEKVRKTIIIEGLKLSHSIEVKQLQLQLRHMQTQNNNSNAENEAEIEELKSKHHSLETQIENKTKILVEEREQSARQLREKQEQLEIQIETNRKILSDAQDVQSRSKEITMLQGTVSKLQLDITDKDTVIEMKEATIRRKESELEAKSRALGEKDATISAMTEQITKTRDYLATKQQVRILVHA